MNESKKDSVKILLIIVLVSSFLSGNIFAIVITGFALYGLLNDDYSLVKLTIVPFIVEASILGIVVFFYSILILCIILSVDDYDTMYIVLAIMVPILVLLLFIVALQIFLIVFLNRFINDYINSKEQGNNGNTNNNIQNTNFYESSSSHSAPPPLSSTPPPLASTPPPLPPRQPSSSDNKKMEYPNNACYSAYPNNYPPPMPVNPMYPPYQPYPYPNNPNYPDLPPPYVENPNIHVSDEKH